MRPETRSYTFAFLWSIPNDWGVKACSGSSVSLSRRGHLRDRTSGERRGVVSFPVDPERGSRIKTTYDTRKSSSTCTPSRAMQAASLHSMFITRVPDSFLEQRCLDNVSFKCALPSLRRAPSCACSLFYRRFHTSHASGILILALRYDQIPAWAIPCYHCAAIYRSLTSSLYFEENRGERWRYQQLKERRGSLQF